MWEIFAKDITDKGIAFKIFKELLKLNNNKRNNPIKKIGKIPEQTPYQSIQWTITSDKTK